MSTSSDISVGLAHKMCNSATAQGYTPELMNALAQDPKLFGQLLQVQLGFAEIKPIEHLINCDAKPFILSGSSIAPDEEQLPNRVKGSFKWSSDQMKLYQSEPQRQGKGINGYELKKKLMDKEVLPANVLDYLLAHPHLIPEEWKGKYVFFWGTIYRDSSGGPCVRYLYWDGDRCDWGYGWLYFGWHGGLPAALRA